MDSKHSTPIHILLADDDKDDRFFFSKALEELPLATIFTTVEDGEKLIAYLLKKAGNLPDALFLDLNMPRKNGSECLSEIKANKELSSLPVIIYSTSLHEDVADVLYKNGAHYYVKKTDFNELKRILARVLQLLLDKKFTRPPREEFIISLVES